MIPIFYFAPTIDDEPVSLASDPAPAPKPQPELPPEVWQTQPVDASRAWGAVVALCRSA